MRIDISNSRIVIFILWEGNLSCWKFLNYLKYWRLLQQNNISSWTTILYCVESNILDLSKERSIVVDANNIWTSRPSSKHFGFVAEFSIFNKQKKFFFSNKYMLRIWMMEMLAAWSLCPNVVCVNHDWSFFAQIKNICLNTIQCSCSRGKIELLPQPPIFAII